MRTSKENLQSLDDVAETSPSPPRTTLSRKIHNQNNNALLVFFSLVHHENASIYRL
jgi:hypothetical protein